MNGLIWLAIQSAVLNAVLEFFLIKINFTTSLHLAKHLIAGNCTEKSACENAKNRTQFRLLFANCLLIIFRHFKSTTKISSTRFFVILCNAFKCHFQSTQIPGELDNKSLKVDTAMARM